MARRTWEQKMQEAKAKAVRAQAKRDRFATAFQSAVARGLLRMGAWHIAGHQCPRAYHLDTPAGALEFHIYDTWIAGRFQDVEAAVELLGGKEANTLGCGKVNPYSGKYNFHYSHEANPAECAQDFLRRVAFDLWRGPPGHAY